MKLTDCEVGFLRVPKEKPSEQLEIACSKGDLNALKCLITPENVDIALLFAHNNESVSYLLSNNADPNYIHPTLGFSTLHAAVYKHPNIVHSLLKAKANPHAQSNGLTPLEIALVNKEIHETDNELDELSARYLIHAGARLSDIRDQDIIPHDIRIYHRYIHFKKQSCRKATLTFWYIMRRNGCPKDLTEYVCCNYLMPTWDNEVWGLKRKQKQKTIEYLQIIGVVLFLIFILKNSFI